MEKFTDLYTEWNNDIEVFNDEDFNKKIKFNNLETLPKW